MRGSLEYVAGETGKFGEQVKIANLINTPEYLALRKAREANPVESLAADLFLAGLPAPVRELRFAPPRRWRADLSYPDLHILIEVEGGTYVQGRHVRPQGYENDAEKYNHAALDGWLVLRFTSAMVKDGRAVQVISRAWHQETARTKVIEAGITKGLARARESEAQA